MPYAGGPPVRISFRHSYQLLVDNHICAVLNPHGLKANIALPWQHTGGYFKKGVCLHS